MTFLGTIIQDTDRTYVRVVSAARTPTLSPGMELRLGALSSQLDKGIQEFKYLNGQAYPTSGGVSTPTTTSSKNAEAHCITSTTTTKAKSDIAKQQPTISNEKKANEESDSWAWQRESLKRIFGDVRIKDEEIKSDFLAKVTSSATEGEFNVTIPHLLEKIIKQNDYKSALLAGASSYFTKTIKSADLQNYDSIVDDAPHSLKELSQEIKAVYVSDAILSDTGIRLDEEQLRAVIATNKVMKVTARAGSGKTRVLVVKAFYLIKYYDVNPNSILLLTFNKNAARELQDRLKSLLEVDSFHTARTFHSLAIQIAKPESELMMSDNDPAADQVGKIIQEILRGLWNGDILESIYTFFREEAREYEGLGLHLRGEAFYKFRRSQPQATLQGGTVRSHGEKYIADYLFEHGIGYKYEPTFTMPAGGIYRPDFEIWTGDAEAKKKFIWEHWAFDPDRIAPSSIDGWSTQDITQYKMDVTRKRRYWADKGRVLIETHTGMLNRGRQSFEEEVSTILMRHGIDHTKLPRSELLEKVEMRLRSKLANLMKGFVNRSLSSEVDIEALLTRINEYQADNEREQFFLDFGSQILPQYLQHLEENKLIDFSLLFPEAIGVLSKKRSIPPVHASGGNMIDLNSVDYILVDEAQDLTLNYLKLLKSLNKLRPNTKMMFVGDDWQAINRFSGADVNLFIQLKKHYYGLSEYTLKSNYRSRKGIVDAGNLLMGGNPIEHAKPTELAAAKIQSTDIDSVWLEFRKDEKYKYDRLSDQKFLWGKDASEGRKYDSGEDKARLVKAIYSVCKPMVSKAGNIAVLFRMNKYKGSFIDDIRNKVLHCFTSEGFTRAQIENMASRLEFSTAHRSKGKEYDTVLVVSPHYGSYPCIHPDAQLLRFFGESPKQGLEDEMRLFYVAITRAERRLIFLKEASKNNESPFLSDFDHLVDDLKLSQLCS
jgi:DNA helicase-4